MINLSNAVSTTLPLIFLKILSLFFKSPSSTSSIHALLDEYHIQSTIRFGFAYFPFTYDNLLLFILMFEIYLFIIGSFIKDSFMPAIHHADILEFSTFVKVPYFSRTMQFTLPIFSIA